MKTATCAWQWRPTDRWQDPLALMEAFLRGRHGKKRYLMVRHVELDWPVGQETILCTFAHLGGALRDGAGEPVAFKAADAALKAHRRAWKAFAKDRPRLRALVEGLMGTLVAELAGGCLHAPDGGLWRPEEGEGLPTFTARHGEALTPGPCPADPERLRRTLWQAVLPPAVRHMMAEH